MNLGIGRPGDTVRDELRRALADPDLDIVYPRVGTGGWVDELGEATTPAAIAGRAFTSIDRGGNRSPHLSTIPPCSATRGWLQAATAAASLAIDNERLKAQLRAQFAEVNASRARIVDAGHRELRRVERNLHDGAPTAPGRTGADSAARQGQGVGRPGVELINTYDDTDTIEELMQLPGMSMICRGSLYEALRACSADGPLTPDELDRLQKGADSMGIPRETFAEVHQIVVAEQALRAGTYELIVAPVLPNNVETNSS
jgi:hypothetical protein